MKYAPTRPMPSTSSARSSAVVADGDAHAAGEAALFAGVQRPGGEAVVVVELHEQFPIEAREADFLKGAGKLPVREVGIVAVQQFGNDAQHVVQIVRGADDARNAADLPEIGRTPVVIEFVAGLVVCRKGRRCTSR